MTVNSERTVTATFALIPIGCGNGFREGVEECDDGNTNNNDARRALRARVIGRVIGQ